VKIFINYMWNFYQPRILKTAFLAYILYMFIVIFVTSFSTERFMEDMEIYAKVNEAML